jgi:frataxin-like iron-binding protein CyaY
MTPELTQALARITVLENQLKQFQNAAELDPQIQRTILAVVGGLNTLDSLSDVVLISPTNGQVLKYNGSTWVNDTDNT